MKGTKDIEKKTIEINNETDNYSWNIECCLSRDMQNFVESSLNNSNLYPVDIELYDSLNNSNLYPVDIELYDSLNNDNTIVKQIQLPKQYNNNNPIPIENNTYPSINNNDHNQFEELDEKDYFLNIMEKVKLALWMTLDNFFQEKEYNKIREIYKYLAFQSALIIQQKMLSYHSTSFSYNVYECYLKKNHINIFPSKMKILINQTLQTNNQIPEETKKTTENVVRITKKFDFLLLLRRFFLDFCIFCCSNRNKYNKINTQNTDNINNNVNEENQSLEYINIIKKIEIPFVNYNNTVFFGGITYDTLPEYILLKLYLNIINPKFLMDVGITFKELTFCDITIQDYIDLNFSPIHILCLITNDNVNTKREKNITKYSTNIYISNENWFKLISIGMKWNVINNYPINSDYNLLSWVKTFGKLNIDIILELDFKCEELFYTRNRKEPNEKYVHIYFQPIFNVEQLKQCGIGINELITMGLNRLLFKSFQYSPNEWKILINPTDFNKLEDISITKSFLLEEVNWTQQDINRLLQTNHYVNKSYSTIPSAPLYNESILN
jgi:hypothetical protein